MTPRKRVPWWAEWVCFVAGHNWKSSWRQKVNRTALMASDEAEWPYRLKREGNPYCEYSAGWVNKCRRCRHRTRDPWPTGPWYRRYWWALGTGWRSFSIGATCYWTTRKRVAGRYYKTVPLSASLASVVAAVAHGVGSTLLHIAHDRHWPVGPAIALLDFDYWVIGRYVEPRVVYYTWVAPKRANGIGFWRGDSDTFAVDEILCGCGRCVPTDSKYGVGVEGGATTTGSTVQPCCLATMREST